MPELPDVEVVKQYADATSLHQKVQVVRVGERRMLASVSAEELASGLEGHIFEATQRHGKYLFLGLDDANSAAIRRWEVSELRRGGWETENLRPYCLLLLQLPARITCVKCSILHLNVIGEMLHSDGGER